MGTVIHREFHHLGLLAASLGAFGIGLAIASALVDGWTGGVLALAAVITVFPVLFLAGVHRMNRIRLTADELVVGSDRFRPSDFDISFGVQPSLVLDPDEQAEIESRWKLGDERPYRIAGGSWGRRVGTAMVVLQERDGRGPIAIFTRHPAALDAVLTEWLETAGGIGSETDSGIDD